jgi:hypothetical protein
LGELIIITIFLKFDGFTKSTRIIFLKSENY